MLNRQEKDNKLNRYVREKIKAAREQLELSQVELGKSIYKTGAAVSDIERGRVQVTVSDLALIAAALQKPITYFFPPRFHGPNASGLSPEEKEILAFYRQIEGYDELQLAAIKQVRTLAEAATSLAEDEIRLPIEGKLPDQEP